MLLRDRIFSLAFLSFLIFSPPLLSMSYGEDESNDGDVNEISFTEFKSSNVLASGLDSNSSNEFYEYVDENGEIRDTRVEVLCEGDEILAPIYTCGDVTSKLNNFVPGPKCTPTTINWTIKFRFPAEDVAAPFGTYKIIFFWDFDNDPANSVTVNAAWVGDGYEAAQSYTYPQGTEEICTRGLLARLFIVGVGACNNTNATAFEEIVTWDDISNPFLGTHDIDHDPSSAGVEIGETVELCQSDNSAVRLQDVSTFNCQAGVEPNPANENRESRWVQWLYGTFSDITTGPGATEKIIINGVSYTNADLPVYGNPTQQLSPPDVFAPNAITDDIQMPTSALVGERFEVTIRSFNVCNPYSTNNDLSPPQGGANDVFQINGAGTEQPALNLITGGANFFANDTPITRTFDIIIAPQPPPPVAVPKDVCNGSSLPRFEITAAGNVAVEWFEDNAGVPGPLIGNSLGANSLELRTNDFEPGGAINNNTAGVYEVWARYSSNTGTQLCWSEPVITSLDVREELLDPASVSSTAGGPGFTICADGPNIVFSVDDGPPGVGVPGGAWEYDWSFGGGSLNDNLTFTTGDGGQTRTVDITSNAASGARQVRVRKRYTNAADNGDCPTGRFNFDFIIDPVSIGGSLTGTNTICLGDNTGNIQLTGQTGAITGWEVNINGGGFVVDGSLGVANPINPVPAVLGTHEYKAIVKSGVCASAESTTVTVTVNPVPPKPTITPTGPTTFCEDTNVTLSSSNTDADSYQWYKDGAPVGGETSQTIFLSTIAESGNYTVEVIGIGPSLCTSPLSDPEPVLVNPLPTATVMGGGSVCSGNPAPDMVWTIVGTPPFSFTITRPAGEGAALPVVEPTNTYTYSGALSGGNYTMTILQDANGCNSISMGGAAVVTVGGITPTLSNLAVDNPICEDQVPGAIPFWHVDTDVAGDYEIDYTIDGNPQPTETFNGILAGGTISHQVNYAQLGSTPGTYTVVLTGAVNTVTGCLATLPGGSVDIIINPQPADATNPVNNISCSAGAGVVLSVDAPPGATIIHWYQDAGLTTDAAPAFGSVAGAQDQAFTPTASTTATFYAVVESTTVPTFCQSANAVAVTQTEDQQPSLANAEDGTAIGVPPAIVGTCDDTFTFNATAADNGGTGTWTTGTAGVTFSNANDPAAMASSIPLGIHTFTWTVTSALGVCATSFDSYDVERHTLPAANDMTADFCEILPQGSNSYDVTAVDLTSFDDTVTGIAGSTDRAVAYFTDVALTIPVATPYTVADNALIFARVLRTDVAPQCQSSSTITFNIITLPDAIDQDDVVNPLETEFCEDFPVGSGTKAGINLTNLDDNVTNGQANRSVAWFTDPGYSVAVPDETNASATNGTIFYPRVTETASGQACIDDAEVTITVNTRPSANPIIGADTQCISVSTSLYQIIPGPAGTTYIWNVPAGFTVFGGGTPVDFFVLLQFPAATTQTLEVTEISPDNCAGVLEQLVITVQPTPPISVITGTAAVCENEAGVPYSVTNTANTTYAWTVPVGASIILGQGTSSVIVNFGVTGGNVEVIPTSSAGCSGGTATLGVTVNPLPILDPNLDNTVCSQDDININLVHDGGSPVAAATFDVTASVTPGLVANVGPTTGNGLLSAAIFNDNYTNTTGGPLIVIYTVTPISADNCAGPTVNVFATINPEPSMAAGLDVIVCSDVAIGLNLSTAGGSVVAASYNVTIINVAGGLTPGGSNAVVQNNVAANYLSLDTYNNIGNIPLVVQYTVVPVSANNCLGSPLLINATIDPEPVIDPTLDTTECSDLPIGVTLATDGVSIAAANYNLVNVAIPGGLTAGGANAVFPLNGIANSFINSDTYTNVNTLPLDVVYEVQGVSAGGCIGDSEFITVTINPEPVMSSILSTTVCSDAASGITFASVGTAVAANDYNVVNVVIPVGVTPAGTNAAIPANNQAPGYINGDSYTNLTALAIDVIYEVRGVSAAGCVGDSEFITLTVDPEPVIDPALDATVCSDDVIGITFNTNGISVAALSYDLLSINMTPGLVANVGNVILANGIMAGYIAGDIFTNTTNASLTVVYEVRGTAAATGCKGDSEFITATIDPEPVISPALNTTVCSDAITNVNFNNNGTSIPAANYNVVNVTIPAGITAGVGNVAVPANGVVAGYIALDTYTNQTANPLVVIYDVQGVSGTGCVGDIESISITINPEPVINTGLDAIACSDAIIGLTLNTNGASVAAANYNIIAVTIPAGLTAGANAVVPANAVGVAYLNGDLYTNQTNAPIIVIYEVKGVSAIACVGDSEFINITIDPEPVIDSTLGGTVCSDAAITLVLATDGTSVPAIDYNVVNVSLAAGLIAGGGNVAVPANNVALGYLALDTYTNPTNASLTVTYEVAGISAAGCVGNSEFINITIDPEPVISPTLDKTVCSDATIGLTLTTIGTSVAAANYNVKAATIPAGLTAAGTNAVVPGNAVAAGYIFTDSYTNQTAAAINVTYEVTGVSGAGCEGAIEFIIVTINPEPVIDPALDATVCSDNVVAITLNTNGTSVAAANYNIIAVTIPAGLAPAGTNVLFPVNGVAANYFTNDSYTNQTTGQLIVTYEVSGVSGLGCTGDSEIISVTIDAEPVVSNALNTTVCSDDVVAVNFSTDPLSIGALNYNLLNVTISAGLLPAGGNVGFPANAVAAAYIAGDSFTNTTAGSLTVTYDVQGVSAVGCVGDSRAIVVTIDPEPVVDPALDNTVCSDQLIGLIFATDGVSIAAANYNLVSVVVAAGLTAGGGNVVPANGINTNYVSGDLYTNLTNASINVTYEVQGVSAGGCTGDSEFIIITIDPEPVMNAGLDNTICSDQVSALMLNDNGAGIAAATFNIVAVTIPAGLTPAGGNAAFPTNGVATGYLSADTYNNVTAVAIIVIYEVRGVSAAGCIGDSEFINITIDPEPVMSAALNTTICSDEITNVIFNTNGTSVGAANYDVINVTIPAGLTPAGTNVVFPANTVAAGYIANDTYTNQTNGVINVTYEVRGTSAVGCVGLSELIIVAINPEPIINTGLDNSICSDAATGLVLNTNGTSIGASNYNIIGITVDPGLTANPSNVVIPAIGVASAYLSGDVYTNATSTPLDVVYEVRGVSLSACEGDSEFIAITVEPGPIIDTALDVTVCSEDAIGVIFGTVGGSVAAVSYNVVGITPNPSLIVGGGNVPIAIGVAANYIINDTYTNTTSIPLTVIYEVKAVSAATCIGPSEFITVTIDPEPVLDPGLDKAVCSEDAVGLILNTNGVSVGATIYNVVNVIIPAGLTPDAANAAFPAVGVVDGYLSDDKYTNLTNASLVVIYEARGESASTCEGQSRFINITIDPQPVIDPGLNTTVCSDDAVGVTLATNGVSVAAAAYNMIAVTVAGGLTASGSNVAIPANGVATGYFTADSYTNLTNTPLDVIYEVQGVSAGGCIGNSEFITVTIDGEPVIDPAITNTVCSDEIIAINLGTLGTSVAAASYDVLSVIIPAGLAAGANVAIPGNAVGLGYLATDSYTNLTASPIIVTYEVRGTSLSGCVGDSEFIGVAINPEPVLNPALDATNCSDEISGIVFSTNGTSVTATTFNLVSVTLQAGLIPGAGNMLPALGVNSTYIQNDQFTNTSNIDLIVQYVVEPVSPQNCVGDQVTVLLTVHPEPVLDPGLSPAPVCSDVPSNVTLTVAAGSVAADHYNIVNITWDPALLPGGANSSIGNNQAANAIFADTYTNTSNVQKLVFYDIVPVSADNCAGDIAQVIFTINPAPAMSNALDKIVCIDQASGIILATNGVSTPAQDYEVQSVLAPGLTAGGGNVALPVTSNNALVINGDMYNNPTDNPLTAIYTVVPISAAGCRGPVMDITLTVEPTITAVANNTLPTICSNVNADITLTSPTVPTAGNIVFNLTAVASSPSVSGFIPVLNFLPQGYVITDFLVNSGNTAETVTYTITPVASGAANGNGCTGTSIVEVVTVNPTPLITPGQFDIVCSNTATNYTITTINSLVGTTFTWLAPTLSDPGLTGGTARAAGSSAPITDTFINTTNIRQMATYNITPTSPSGCVGNIVQLIIFVDPLPDGTISVDQPVVCMNSSAILGFTITVGVAPYEIVYSDGTTDFTVSNIGGSHFIAKNNLTATTTYEFKSILDVNGCLQNLVGQMVTVTVENPVSDFTADITNDCTPLLVTFTNNNIQAGTQYEWNWGDGSPIEIDNSLTVTHTFINNSTVSDISFNTILTAQRTNGAVVCTNASSEFITIKAGVNLNVIPSTTEGCSPLLVSFMNNSQGVLANTWFWREQGTTDQNDLTNISSASFVINNPTTTTKIYEVVYQGDRNGCSDEIITEITVHPELVADFSVAPSTVVSITNPTITVTNNTLNKASWNHVWDWGDASPTTNAIDPGAHTYAAFGYYVLSLSITDPSGFCTSKDSVTITVEPVLPVVDFSFDPKNGCRPLTVNFTNLSTSVDPDTYLWEFRDQRGQLIGTSNLVNPSFTFFEAGLINITLSGSNPLGITDSKTVLGADPNGNGLEVFDIPTASFTTSAETVFLPDQWLFTSNLSALADAWQWDFNGDGDIDSEEFEPQYLYETAGVFDISLIATNTTTTCTDTLVISPAVTVIEGGVADIPNGFFPGSGNSSGGTGGSAGAPNSVFLPRLKGVRDDGFEMQIFDRWGHLIFESKDKTIGWDGRDGSGKLYPVGVYVYKVDVLYLSGQQTTILGDVTLIR